MPDYSKKYDIFLSYRRDGGESMAILLRDRLTAKGYSVFLDVESLNSGSFNEKLLSTIESCTDFIVVCSKGSLDRCVNADDWVRAEIACAFKHRKNIVPVMLRGFEWPDTLPDDIVQLRTQNGVSASNNEYFDAAVDRLAEKFLKSTPQETPQTAGRPKKAGFVLAVAALLVIAIAASAIAVIMWTRPSETDNIAADVGNKGGGEAASVSKDEKPVNKNEEPVKAEAAYDEDIFEIRGGILLKYYGADSEVIIPDVVKVIGEEAFAKCVNLIGITIPDGVTSIGQSAFNGCSGLTGVNIPESVTSIGRGAFQGCNNLTGVTIQDGITSIGDSAFKDCTNLINVTIPGSVTNIEGYAFQNCGNLSSITIPYGVTSIEIWAFYNCTNLTGVSIPSSVASIGSEAFGKCSNLTSVTIQDGVTSIGYAAFSNCTALTGITIPESVTNIGDGAFRGCSNLTGVIILGNPEIGGGAFDSSVDIQFK